MFGFQLIKSPQPLLDLNAISTFSNIPVSSVRILVADNKDVPQVDILRERGFNIKKVNDIEDLEAVSSYDIAMIDIRDIGSKFQSPFEGAYVAKRVKEYYPYKKVILFTGSTYEDKYNDILRLLDGYLKKDASTDDWEDKLREMISQVTNPVSQWKILRSRLLESDVDSLLVYRLEQKYITAMKAKSPHLFPTEKLALKLPEPVQKIVVELTKSAVFTALGLPKP